MSINRGPLVAAVVIVVVAIAVIVFVVVGSGDGAGTSAFETAKAECAEASPHVSLLDEGRGLSVSGEGDEASGATIVEIVCVLDLLGVPDAVVSRMNQTRALDGTQDATWDDVRASWTYHPDAGLNIVFEEDT